MTSIKNILSGIVLLSVWNMTSNAQNLDQTVEVSRNYDARLMEIHKPVLTMEVPDSVRQFDLDFDYSVFDNPYKGAYEFNPYLLNMKPESAPYAGSRFLFRAGAGYPLHPELDVVWSPALNGKFRMSIYGTHRSYFGKYRSVFTEKSENTGFWNVGSVKSGGWNGLDALSRAGIDGRFDWSKGYLSFDVGYYGLASKDNEVSRSYNGADYRLNLRSVNYASSYFYYDVMFKGRTAADDFTVAGMEGKRLAEQNFVLNTSFGAAFADSHKVLVDFDMDMASYRSCFNSDIAVVSVVPNYEYSKGRWDIDLGLKLSFVTGGDNGSSAMPMHGKRGQLFFPDVKVGFKAVTNWVNLYLKAGGGNSINSYASLIDRNHFVTPYYNSYAAPLMDNTVERISGQFGIEGNIASRLTYDINVGYSDYANALTDIVSPLVSAPLDVSGMSHGIDVMLGYNDFGLLRAAADLGWKSQDVEVSASIEYRKTMRSAGFVGFEVSPLVASVEALYNWNRRIFAGVSCDYHSGRDGLMFSDSVSLPARLPGFADLGIYMEYRINRKFSVWAKGSNLLDMPVQHVPGYVESGIYFTAGICLNLQ